MKFEEVEAYLNRTDVRDQLKHLFQESKLNILQITMEIGLKECWKGMVSSTLKELVGEDAFIRRLKHMRTVVMPDLCMRKQKLCGECKDYKPDRERLDGVLGGTCKITGERVERCSWCKANTEVQKHDAV